MRLSPIAAASMFSMALGGTSCVSPPPAAPAQTAATAPAATAPAAPTSPAELSALLADHRGLALRSEGDLAKREPTQGPPEAPQALKLTFSAKPERYWDTELTAGGLETQKGTRYRLSFWARADAPRQLLVDLSNESSPWNPIGFSRTVQVGTDWKKYEWEVKPTAEPITTARICIKVGQSADAIAIAGFRFEGPAGSPGAMVAAGSIPTNKEASQKDLRFRSEPGVARMVVEDAGGPPEAPQAMKIAFDRQGARFWDVEVQANRVDVREGKVYRVSFWARSDATRAMLVDVSNDGSPWNPLGLNANVRLTPAWKRYDYVFRADADPRTVGRVCFKLAHTAEPVWLSGFVFHEASEADAPKLDRTKVVTPALSAEMSARIDKTIREVRQAPFKVRVVDAAGKPIPGAEVEIKLQRHAFLFGTTLPHRDWRPEAQTEQQKRFLGLAEPIATLIVPENSTKGEFWNSQPSFAQSIWELAKARGLAFKSHAAVWGWELRERRKSIKTCAEFEADALKRLEAQFTAFKGNHVVSDVANEMVSEPYAQELCGGEQKLIEIYKRARALDPSVKLSVNDYDQMTNRGTRVDDLVKRFKAAGVPVAVQGEQLHDRNIWYSPEELWGLIDRMAANGVEVHLTELTQPDDGSTILGDYQRNVVWNAGNQAAYFEQTYRLAFGHPAVGAIVLWNLWDGASWLPRGGIVERDFTPKPAYQAIQRLIQTEWTTNLTLKTDGKGRTTGRGFLGSYAVTARAKGKTQSTTVNLTGGTAAEWEVRIP